MTEVKLEEERHKCSAVVQEVKEEPDCGGVQGPHEAAPSLDRIKEEPEEVQIKQESIRAFPVIVSVRSVKEESVLHETVKQEKTQDTVGAETETSSDTDDSGDWTAETMNHAAVLQEMEPAQPPRTLEKRHSCDQCGKRFTASKYLKQHKIFYSEKKPHQCDQCGKAFRISPHLRQHARTHTGERPYECERCDKAFTQPGPLKRHLRIHTGEKPYGCDECKKTFNQQGNLTQHKKTHGRSKLFRCDQCGKAFSKTGYLKAHMKLHTGAKL